MHRTIKLSWNQALNSLSAHFIKFIWNPSKVGRKWRRFPFEFSVDCVLANTILFIASSECNMKMWGRNASENTEYLFRKFSETGNFQWNYYIGNCHQQHPMKQFTFVHWDICVACIALDNEIVVPVIRQIVVETTRCTCTRVWWFRALFLFNYHSLSSKWVNCWNIFCFSKLNI